MSLAVRPGILDIAAYVPGEHALPRRRPGLQDVVQRESARAPARRRSRPIAALCGELHRYPDGGSHALRAALAATIDGDPGQIVCGAGSDEILLLLTRAYAGPGDEVLYSQHGFLVYPIAAQSVGATPVAAPEKNLTTDVDALLAHVTPRTKICFVAEPNNPTGSYIGAAELKRLRDGLPDERAAGGRRRLCRICRPSRLQRRRRAGEGP